MEYKIPENTVIIFNSEQLRTFIDEIRAEPRSCSLAAAGRYLNVSKTNAWRLRKQLNAYRLSVGGEWHVDMKDVYALKQKRQRESAREMKVKKTEETNDRSIPLNGGRSAVRGTDTGCSGAGSGIAGAAGIAAGPNAVG